MSSSQATTVWLKDTNDLSTWPQGFNIPLPPPGQLIVTNGLLQTSNDTAFDGFMRTYAGPGVIVYLSPGTFVTFGMIDNYLPQNSAPGWRLQDGSQLHGAAKSGNNKTTIKIVGVNASFGATAIGSNQLVFDKTAYTSYHNIWVTDLAVDCNASNIINGDLTKPWQMTAVELYGAGSMHIQNVSVTNPAGGYPPQAEDFILSINSTASPSSDNWIVGCDVLNFYNPDGNGACSAISLNKRGTNTLGYIAGAIQNCTVSLNGFLPPSNGFGKEYAYNGTLWDDVLFQNNTASGAARAFNNDSGTDLAATFVGNTFNVPPGLTNNGSAYGFYLVNGATLCRFHDNYINMWGANASGVVISGPAAPKQWTGGNNLLFDYNHVFKIGAWSGPANGFNLSETDPLFTPAQQIDLENNTVDSGLSNVLPSSSGLYLRNSGTSFPAFPSLNWGPSYPPSRADFRLTADFELILQDANINLECVSLSSASARGLTSFNPSSVSQAGWALVGSGDGDRDGKSDLFFQHPSYGIGIWAMDGTTMVTTWGGPVTFNGQTLIPGGTWKVVGVADFNGDCKPDLLFQDDSSYLAIWHLDGTNVATTSLLTPSASGGINGGIWRVVGTGDFNHDGWTDILFQYDDVNNPYLDGQLAVWYMQDTTMLSGALLNPQFPSDVKYRVVATADFYHTKNTSIVFQYKNPRTSWGGNLMAWPMNQVNQVRADTISLGVGGFNVVGPR